MKKRFPAIESLIPFFPKIVQSADAATLAVLRSVNSQLKALAEAELRRILRSRCKYDMETCFSPSRLLPLGRKRLQWNMDYGNVSVKLGCFAGGEELEIRQHFQGLDIEQVQDWIPFCLRKIKVRITVRFSTGRRCTFSGRLSWRKYKHLKRDLLEGNIIEARYPLFPESKLSGLSAAFLSGYICMDEATIRLRFFPTTFCCSGTYLYTAFV
ncbi:MAG: hypothetical protein SGCHY_004852 [Lobulomycetales sp.]